jgi:hypothetical protein
VGAGRQQAAAEGVLPEVDRGAEDLVRRKVQVTLTLMPGRAEAWILVRHPGGAFKLPGDVSALELLTGALEGWNMVHRRPRRGEATVRVPISQWAEAEAALRSLERRHGLDPSD